MKVVHLAKSAEAQREAASPTDTGTEAKYPSGMAMHMSTEEMKMLGMNAPPDVGHEYDVAGRAKVVGVHTTQNEGEAEPTHHVHIQMTHMGMDKRATTAAGKLYGSAVEPE